MAKPEECMALNFLKGDFIYRAWMEKEEEREKGFPGNPTLLTNLIVRPGCLATCSCKGSWGM